MRRYKVFEHPSGAVEAVKQGWSWPAFLFGALWAMTKRMWGLGLGVLAGSFLVGFALGAAGGDEGLELILNIAAFVLALVFGAQGNSWRETKLVSRGFEAREIVEAPDSGAAIFQAARSEASAPAAS